MMYLLMKRELKDVSSRLSLMMLLYWIISSPNEGVNRTTTKHCFLCFVNFIKYFVFYFVYYLYFVAKLLWAKQRNVLFDVKKFLLKLRNTNKKLDTYKRSDEKINNHYFANHMVLTVLKLCTFLVHSESFT